MLSVSFMQNGDNFSNPHSRVNKTPLRFCKGKLDEASMDETEYNYTQCDAIETPPLPQATFLRVASLDKDFRFLILATLTSIVYNRQIIGYACHTSTSDIDCCVIVT